MASGIDIDRILAAPHWIDPVFLDSPILTDSNLDDALGCRLSAKLETENPIGSFKGRGAEFFVATALAPGEAVVCASAGNFGQGLAWAARKRGHRCIVFAAENANPVKVEAMRRFGAEVRLLGADFDAAKDAAWRYAAVSGLRHVEDGAEPAIAEGAGTIGTELAAAGSFDAVVVPLGNGALLAGVGTVLRHLAPRTQVIAVVARNAPAMKLSLEAGRVVQTARSDTIADGIAVRVPIAATLPMLRGCCDAIVSVTEQALFEAMALAQRHLGRVVEAAGAAGIAAILAEPQRFAGRRVATVLCGSHVDAAMQARLLA